MSSEPVTSTDPYATPERRALRALVADFTAREIAPHLPAWEREGQLPRELHRRAAEAGILGIGFPEEVGGSGGDLIDEGQGEIRALAVAYGLKLTRILRGGFA